MHFLLPPGSPIRCIFSAHVHPTCGIGFIALRSLSVPAGVWVLSSDSPFFALHPPRFFVSPLFFPDTRGGKGLTTGRRKHPLSPRMHAPMDRERALNFVGGRWLLPSREGHTSIRLETLLSPLGLVGWVSMLARTVAARPRK